MSSEFSNARENFEAFQSNVNILSVTQTRITNAIRLGFLEPKAFVNYAESARMQERFGRRLPIIPPTVFYKKRSRYIVPIWRSSPIKETVQSRQILRSHCIPFKVAFLSGSGRERWEAWTLVNCHAYLVTGHPNRKQSEPVNHGCYCIEGT